MKTSSRHNDCVPDPAGSQNNELTVVFSKTKKVQEEAVAGSRTRLRTRRATATTRVPQPEPEPPKSKKKTTKKAAPEPAQNPALPPPPKILRPHLVQPAKEVKVEKVYWCTNKDVLCGRGFTHNPGNIRFRLKLYPFRKPYSTTDDYKLKRSIAHQVYHAVVEGGNRFLEVVEGADNSALANLRGNKKTKVPGRFRTIPVERCIEKIAQALRENKWQIPPPYDTLPKPPEVPLPEQKKKPEIDSALEVPEEKAEEDKPFEFKHVLLFNADPAAVAEVAKQLEEEDDTEALMAAPEGFSAIRPVDLANPPTANPPTRKRSYTRRNNSNSNPRSAKRTKGLKFEMKEWMERVDEKEVVFFKELDPSDVVFGRAKHFRAHPGTVTFRQVLHRNKKTYSKLGQGKKSPLAFDIFKHFGGRFFEVHDRLCGEQGLDPAHALLKPVGVKKCVPKICQMLRYLEDDNDDMDDDNDDDDDVEEDDASEEHSESKSNKRRRSKKSMRLPGESSSESDEDSIAAAWSTVPSTKVTKKDHTNVVLGSRIAVYWPLDSTYYEAVVENCRVERDRRSASFGTVVYHIKYDDSQEEWIDLNVHEYKVVETKQRQKTGQVQQPFKIVRLNREGKVKRRGASRSLFWCTNVVVSSDDDGNNEGKKQQREVN